MSPCEPVLHCQWRLQRCHCRRSTGHCRSVHCVCPGKKTHRGRWLCDRHTHGGSSKSQEARAIRKRVRRWSPSGEGWPFIGSHLRKWTVHQSERACAALTADGGLGSGLMKTLHKSVRRRREQGKIRDQEPHRAAVGRGAHPSSQSLGGRGLQHVHQSDQKEMDMHCRGSLGTWSSGR